MNASAVECPTCEADPGRNCRGMTFPEVHFIRAMRADALPSPDHFTAWIRDALVRQKVVIQNATVSMSVGISLDPTPLAEVHVFAGGGE